MEHYNEFDKGYSLFVNNKKKKRVCTQIRREFLSVLLSIILRINVSQCESLLFFFPHQHIAECAALLWGRWQKGQPGLERRRKRSERSSKHLLYKSDVFSLAVLKSFVSH